MRLTPYLKSHAKTFFNICMALKLGLFWNFKDLIADFTSVRKSQEDVLGYQGCEGEEVWIGIFQSPQVWEGA